MVSLKITLLNKLEIGMADPISDIFLFFFKRIWLFGLLLELFVLNENFETLLPGSP